MKAKKSIKEVSSIIDALRGNKVVSNAEYKRVYTTCKRMSCKVFNQYGMGNIIYNPNTKEEVIEDITTIALVKALRGYKPSKKAAFMTYYYNKARSCARVHAGKCHRRFHLINATSLDAYTDRENQEE
jgi:hypothetical protein